MAIQDKFNRANVIYKITKDIDLGGGTLTIPEGCTLDFQGGSFSNGEIVFNKTKIVNSNNSIDCNFLGSLGRIVCSSWFKIEGKDKTIQTKRLQSLIDCCLDNGIIEFANEEFILAKNKLEYYPDGDEPCISVYNRNKLTINFNHAFFKVEEHAQGILEILNSSDIKINGGIFEGCLNFVPLDGISGRGEKGTSSEGYNTTSFWNFYHNNSRDTTSLIGTSANFNGGFIGNCGSGISVRGSNYIKIENSEIRHFNYAGICLGRLQWNNFDNINKFIYIKNCNIYNCYNSGITISNTKDFYVNENEIHDIGHPDNLKTDTYHDPGYGITCTAYNQKYAYNGRINNNNVYNIKRKGLDVHQGHDVEFVNNRVYNCWAGACYAISTSSTQLVYNISFKYNYIEQCCSVPLNEGVFSVGFSGDLKDNWDGYENNCQFIGNTVKNCGGEKDLGIITTDNAVNVIIADNNFICTNEAPLIQHAYVIAIGLRSIHYSTNVIVLNNKIECADNIIGTAIQIRFALNSIISRNIIDMTKATDRTYAISCPHSWDKSYTGIITDNIIHFGTPERAAFALSLNAIKGKVRNNITDFKKNYPYCSVIDCMPTNGNSFEPSEITESEQEGVCYFNTSLNKPLWWKGDSWVDATGAEV